MSYDFEDRGEENPKFLRFLRDLRNYLRIDIGWGREEIDEFLAEPQKFKAYWIDRFSPRRVIAAECTGFCSKMERFT